MQFSPQGGNGTVFALRGNQIEAQRSGFDLERKKELTWCSFRRKAETERCLLSGGNQIEAQRSGFDLERKKEQT